MLDIDANLILKGSQVCRVWLWSLDAFLTNACNIHEVLYNGKYKLLNETAKFVDI